VSVLGDRLRGLRQERGLTLKEVAEIFGTAISTQSAYESGTTRPTPDQLAAYADFYGVSTDYLLGRTDIRRPATIDDPDVQFWLRHAGDLTPEQRQRLREYIEFLKFEHRRKGKRVNPGNREHP